MNFSLLRAPPNPLLTSSATLSCSLNPKLSKPISLKLTTNPIPARDRVIDFGKHKGKMLGTLPSTYLKWVSKNLRARDFEEWAILADQVLQDPFYNDRVEWEYAAKLLNGEVLSSARSEKSSSSVKELLELSERFGWDNEDKVGWSRVDFELLGTSKGGRIPRIGGGEMKREEVSGRDGKNEGRVGVEMGRENRSVGGRREGRRERMRLKRDVRVGEEKVGVKVNEKGVYGNANFEKNHEVGLKEKEKGVNGSMKFEKNHDQNHDDQKVEIYNPFPGRQSLFKKALNRKRPL